MLKFRLSKTLILSLTLITLIYLSLAVYVAKNAEVDTKKNSDVIVVLGAKSIVNGRVNTCLFARVSHGVDLYKAGFAKKIIMSGGIDREDGKVESETMKQIAEDLGVKSEAILTENKSTSTYENLVFSKQILEQNNLISILIVTEAFHSPRASLIAKKLGLNYTVSPSIESICWTENKYFSSFLLKEPLAIIWYKLFGQI